MVTALLLIDFQNDYLNSANLDPHRDAICQAAEVLLKLFRQKSLPVIHVWTTVRSTGEMMPHWRSHACQRCIEGSLGHATPTALRPIANELVLHKQFYSGFTCPELLAQLKSLQVDTLVLTGVYLRACIRTTAVDAYQHGLSVIVAEDAVADDDPVHAAITRQYLSQRSISFATSQQISERPSANAACRDDPNPATEVPCAVIAGSNLPFKPEQARAFKTPRDPRHIAFWLGLDCSPQIVMDAVRSARGTQLNWCRLTIEDRREKLTQLGHTLSQHAAPLAAQITRDVGKPINDSMGEVQFAVQLLRTAARASMTNEMLQTGEGWIARRRPHGVVAMITPWNNPLAIAVGKMAPAILYGNTVVWKPAPAGAALAHMTLGLLSRCGIPDGIVNLVQGGRDVAEHLLSQAGVDAATITGSTSAATAAQVLAASRRIPFQAEMGGNNAAIIWSDTDLSAAARHVLIGGLGAAGQRCTATRRLIVDQRCLKQFVDALHEVARTLVWGDPMDEDTHIGPVISAAAHQRLTALVQRAQQQGALLSPFAVQSRTTGDDRADTFFPPTLVVVRDRRAEIWQCESFGPILVLHQADSWDDALELCNCVPQGLVACLFSESRDKHSAFLDHAQAGMLRVNTATAGASPDAPFSGWKCSAVGPVEHSIGDVEFYTRWQTVYGLESPNVG